MEASKAILLIIIFCLVLWEFISLISIDLQEKKQMDEACKRMGYEKMTSYDRDRCYWGFVSVSIECDNEYINYFSEGEECYKHDKWGDCVKYRPTYTLANASC